MREVNDHHDALTAALEYNRHKARIERAPWIAAANSCLPVDGDLFPVTSREFVRGLGIKTLISMEKAPVFNQMQKEFWTDHFNKQTHSVLKATALNLGLPELPHPVRKAQTVAQLVAYFQVRVTEPFVTSTPQGDNK